MSNAVLEVENLKLYFGKRKKRITKAVDNVSFKILQGETYCLVGESGSGKTTIARAVNRLYEPTDGVIRFKGRDITHKLSKEDTKFLRTKMQMIFQNPIESLNSKKRVKDIVSQGLDIHNIYEKEERKEKVQSILYKVGLNPECDILYPEEFSGGQLQRIGIARALIMKPELIIADECISGLDVSMQAQIINLLKDIQNNSNCSYLFITHDLLIAKYFADRIGVLFDGHLVETGTKEEIFNGAIHPYTKSLISSILYLNPYFSEIKNTDSNKFCLDINNSVNYRISDTHYVLATQEQLKQWNK